jgi:hypothetical protein
MKFVERFVIETIVLGLLVAFVWIASGYPYQAKLVPLVLGVPALILMIVQYVNTVILHRGRENHEEDKSKQSEETTRSELGVVAWLAWLVASTYFFGFLISIVLFLFPMLRFRFAQSLKTSAIITVAVWLGIYLCFEVFLKVPLSCGILFAP